MHLGWYQVAFEREITKDLSPIRIGDRDLILVRTGDVFAAYDAACPHRGAHLAHGGCLRDDHVVCPFHGYPVGLGQDSDHRFRVRGYRTLAVGGLIFVLLDEAHERGFSAAMEELDASQFFVQGFALDTKASPELVVENGFDGAHFSSVHGLARQPRLRLGPSSGNGAGVMVVEGLFEAPSDVAGWGEAETSTAHGGQGARIGFTAHVFSPSLCLTRLETGNGEYRVLSGAVPDGRGTTTVRVSVIAPPGPDGSPPASGAIRQLLRDSRLAYEQDVVIWDHMIPGVEPDYAAGDELIREFHHYCRRFSGAPPA